ncbi:MAG TPA: hypothetical protein PKE52_13550, partial [Bacteroidales bacterium]|nr:hypothetical protein [Bacteroidales bacterium]
GGTSSPYVASGIYKVNIQTGAYTSITTGNYGHSWLKKAPDGHIYAVSDNGETLGRVNQTTGLFEVAFHFPTVDVQGETYQIRYGSYQLMDDNNRCFTLPDDDHVANCPEVIGVSFNTTVCNYIRTSVTITGGTPPYQITWQKWDNSTWITLPYTTQYVDNLAAGHYRVLVTDVNQAGGWFTYEFDVPVNTNVFNDMTVASGNTINYSNQNLNVRTEIRVKPNAKLNLTGCNVYFWPEAKLVIENGGVVVLNNTLLSSCDTMWQGVEVWGDKSKPQYILNGQNWQGSLVMKRSTIENAKTAVALWRPNYYGTTGGIVKAENSVFRNNGKSVFACYYDNIHAVNGMILDNVCRFDNCTFEINQDYKADVMFHKHVDLASVKGIKFNGCNFSVVQTEGVSPWNSGISSYNSGFKVDGYCSSAYLPCPDNSYIYSTFTGFNKGIYALGTGDVTDRTVSVMHSNFINNGTGVKLNMVTSSAICYSNFSIGLSLGDIYSCGDT